ncbi:hypothetical protein [Chitinophaga sp. 212800010-3]|uniref:hypothetical protein n=1 Tax=unclassified Chitinophaga TaxID=2619133 RepID=UPI002DE6BFF2|nr:DUF4258 domain-containing protein [Chitinophaga sp. 212800010-3]
MNSYLKMIAGRLLQKKYSSMAVSRRPRPDKDTRELIALMDNIPNARLVAAAYQRMMRTGRLERRFTSGDPCRGWLEMEQMILDRELRRKENRRKIIWMVLVFAVVGAASYIGGVYLLNQGKNLSVQAR